MRTMTFTTMNITAHCPKQSLSSGPPRPACR
nr:MAG TPA: hypothetical protein [Caudoviricetes sp.]